MLGWIYFIEFLVLLVIYIIIVASAEDYKNYCARNCIGGIGIVLTIIFGATLLLCVAPCEKHGGIVHLKFEQTTWMAILTLVPAVIMGFLNYIKLPLIIGWLVSLFKRRNHGITECPSRISDKFGLIKQETHNSIRLIYSIPDLSYHAYIDLPTENIYAMDSGKIVDAVNKLKRWAELKQQNAARVRAIIDTYEIGEV